MELTLTEHGQIPLNETLLAHLGVKPGGAISVTVAPGGKLNIGAAGRKKSFRELHTFMDAQSRALDSGVRLTIDDIQSAIERGYVEHGMRGLE